ncbi:MAG: anaerobic ribonucleoside-triphosphate reductase activating protein [Brevinematales bacterium]|jgi:pyruvate formate lyase activating enzyme
MFRGIQKVSLIDYPGRIASTFFTAGCNFNCPWCHNRKLVFPDLYAQIPEITEDDAFNYLLSRKGLIQGVCVTGGEPSLWGERLELFFKRCKENGFLTKLDTNGYLPGALKGYLDSNFLDFVAMDIKNTFGKYARTAGLDSIDTGKINESIDLIKRSGISHQFRTTVVPGLVDREEMEALSLEIGEKIVFQEYRAATSNE